MLYPVYFESFFGKIIEYKINTVNLFRRLLQKSQKTSYVPTLHHSQDIQLVKIFDLEFDDIIGNGIAVNLIDDFIFFFNFAEIPNLDKIAIGSFIFGILNAQDRVDMCSRLLEANTNSNQEKKRRTVKPRRS